MLDQLLSWMIIFIPFALSIVLIFMPAKQENLTVHMRWRYALVVLLVAFSLIAWWQQSRAVKSANLDREQAIKETSERVATDTASRVTAVMTAQCTTTIKELDQQINTLTSRLHKENTQTTSTIQRSIGQLSENLVTNKLVVQP